ncbi:MAG TPA: hypothetical protein VED66_13125 [Candidatus Sulfotelmatobacter sp.]|nr:hypothetical protein [Candidatus Sulfotelmatobacter sp.]
MSIPNAVIRDLLPAYVAGDASAESCLVVEEALREDPGLKAEVETLREIPLPQAEPPADLGRLSLERTQALLRRRGSLMAFSLLASSGPMALVGRNWTPLLLGRPVSLWIATVSAAAATAGWVSFLRTVNRLRILGLEPPRRLRIRLAWEISAWWYLAGVGLLTHEWTNGVLVPLAIMAALGGVAVWMRTCGKPR